MASFNTLRLSILVSCVLFALIELGLNTHLTHVTSAAHLTLPIEGLAIVAATLTILTVPVMILKLDPAREGKAFTSKTIAELAWIAVLWALWVATAVASVKTFQRTFKFVIVHRCDHRYPAQVLTACREMRATAAFGFLSWLALIIYILLLTISIRATGRGRSEWPPISDTNLQSKEYRNTAQVV
ncbi:hypothetical protein VKT23_002495 [Stygiomarasmius scandens]|uniref:MARVEL domain-containing protein n=1 Tax=Marasmiellus scandens TaxID=2682957 RepID=A0ABR1K5S5_9AGAR